MEPHIYILIIVLFFLAKKLIAFNSKKHEVLKKVLKENKDAINDANNQFEKLTDFKNGYCTTSAIENWKYKHSDLVKKLSAHDFSKYKENDIHKKDLAILLDRISNSSFHRNLYNKKFTEQELINYETFFNTIEGRKLDNQQRLAIINDDDKQLVVAGAGSGKTTTIVGKIQYIIDRYQIPPETVLAISFTSKSAQTLSERIAIPGLEVKTFHKLGKDIIQSNTKIQPSIFDEAQYDALIQNIIKELAQQSIYLNKLTNYFIKYLKIDQSQFDFDDQGSYIQFLKDQNFRSLKLKEYNYNGKKTFKQEIVKSCEECKIANFLYLNGVNYEYEKPYEYPTADYEFGQYKPDFTIFNGDNRIYLEHWGIDKEGNVPNWFEGKEGKSARDIYQKNKAWKLALHEKQQTKLLESTSYQIQEDEDLNYLLNQLIGAGIQLKPKNDEQIWDLIRNNSREDFAIFTKLVSTTITLLKSNNFNIAHLQQLNCEATNLKLKRRNEKFVELIEPIFNRYNDYLKERNEIDFSDMINIASDSIDKYYKKFKYIIIDEFQDISIGRYKLIQSILDKNKCCKLFCVGDDWQSIYRFSGSDISLFSEFEKYFGKTIISKIETTYRFNEPIISLTSSFILKNPSQVPKNLIQADRTKQTQFSILYSKYPELDYSYDLVELYQQLIEIAEIEKKEILILGRYKRDFEQIGNINSQLECNLKSQIIDFKGVNSKGKKVQISSKFLTIHKSKGLEGDIVILINCNSGKYGFPAEMSDDPILNLLLSNADQYPNGEERRLFYVALTRAKEHTYLLTNPINKSKFIVEIEKTTPANNAIEKTCPRCKNTTLIVKKSGVAKNGIPYRFYGCLNFEYGCQYSETVFENKKKTI
ncbi:MAG: UvrD-helicase domain-containing protein [Sediminibacterium sp.]